MNEHVTNTTGSISTAPHGISYHGNNALSSILCFNRNEAEGGGCHVNVSNQYQ